MNVDPPDCICPQDYVKPNCPAHDPNGTFYLEMDKDDKRRAEGFETPEEREQRIAEEVAAESGGIFTPRVIRKCRALLMARDDYAEKDAAAKAAKVEMDEVELDVFELFEGLQGSLQGKKAGSTVSVPLGEPYGVVKFRTRETHYAKIVDDDKLLRWLEDRAMVDEATTSNFNKSRLHEEVRKRKEADGEMPPGLSYYTKRGMTVTRPR